MKRKGSVFSETRRRTIFFHRNKDQTPPPTSIDLTSQENVEKRNISRISIYSYAIQIDNCSGGVHGSKESCISSVFGSICHIFIDDILIYSKSKDQYEEHLRMELEILRKEKLYAKFKGVNFYLSGKGGSRN
ncbi:uncharacterized protein LOC111371303 [Olea europaea var. sylvestris]|uniref:uncharacterized protein LOC111371303 n=1 Tax=Olea europaea var. sylvestris TaxID=158386 RepID=UPI000C1CCC2B|nr:uncharacterized protein LOC111371303 [Olea europaea var. sylvestris]